LHVLVTGAVLHGSHVVEELLAAGHGGRVFGSRVFGNLSIDRRRDCPEVAVMVGDDSDDTVTAAALAGVEAVCHQAANVGLGNGGRGLRAPQRRRGSAATGSRTC